MGKKLFSSRHLSHNKCYATRPEPLANTRTRRIGNALHLLCAAFLPPKAVSHLSETIPGRTQHHDDILYTILEEIRISSQKKAFFHAKKTRISKKSSGQRKTGIIAKRICIFPERGLY